MAFLLRFQEQCSSTSDGTVATGTETVTFVRAEQVDSDPRQYDLRVVPIYDVQLPSKRSLGNSAMTTGTKTFTEVRREADDTDPTSELFDALARVI